MQLDLLSLEKGINEELSKKANTGMLTLPASSYIPSSITPPPTLPDEVYRDGFLTTGLKWLPEAGALAVNRIANRIAPQAFKYLPRAGSLGWGLLGTGKIQGLIEKYAPETHKEWLEQSGKGFLPPLYKWMDNSRHAHDFVVDSARVGSKAMDAGGEILGEVMNATGAPEATQAMDKATSSTPGLKQVSNSIDSFGREAKNAGGWLPWVRQKGQELYNAGVQGISNAVGGQAGRFIMPALGVGALTLGANYLLGGNKKRRYTGTHGQAPVVNVNIGGGGGQNPGMLNYSRSGVQSLSAPANLTSSYGMDNKYGMDMVKHAFDVTELLTKAVQQRAINKAIDKFQEVPTQTESTPAEEEIEITSKYPEVAKLLKDEQNKAYLDRLLKE
jgi:hypothetical protein